MKGDFPDDTFIESDVLSCLEAAGLRHKNGARYILSQCPTHEDKNPSVQIYKDDWFVNCHSGCGRFHITKAFPELRPDRGGHTPSSNANPPRKKKPVSEHKYIAVDLMDFWKSLSSIPDDFVLHNIPASALEEMGWRYDHSHNRIFIPYFSASRQSIPFAQWRNLGSGPRFNFWKDAKPTCYGTWNLYGNHKLFVCEGASDAAVLDYCLVPWLALPSAASGELMKTMATYCKENGLTVVYAGDNDNAGDKLREALDEVSSYRVKQPPKKYKDWGEFFEAEGREAVQVYCFKELFPDNLAVASVIHEANKEFEVIENLFPGAQQKIVDPEEMRKEQSMGSTPIF